jgi:hypothetical protein
MEAAVSRFVTGAPNCRIIARKASESTSAIPSHRAAVRLEYVLFIPTRENLYRGFLQRRPQLISKTNHAEKSSEGTGKMKAVVWHKIGDIRLDDVPEPKIKEPTDAIVRLTASAICGTDLHFIRGTMPDLEPGTVLEHEGVGVVEEIGPDVCNLDKGKTSTSSLSTKARKYEY